VRLRWRPTTATTFNVPVNASIPKTLVRHLTAYEANHTEGELREVLLDILDTPVSPELLPPVNGEISQKTEDIVGPYELHDFFLYYMLRYGFTPGKIYRMQTCVPDTYGRNSSKRAHHLPGPLFRPAV
jgi:NH3-dependent NAD+ synthetase